MISALFIDRPRLAIVISVVITLAGLISILGIAVAAVSAAAAVKFLVAFLGRQGLAAFAVYRIILAVLLAAVFYL